MSSLELKHCMCNIFWIWFHDLNLICENWVVVLTTNFEFDFTLKIVTIKYGKCCGDLWNFQQLRFYVKSNLVNLHLKKLWCHWWKLFWYDWIRFKQEFDLTKFLSKINVTPLMKTSMCKHHTSSNSLFEHDWRLQSESARFRYYKTEY